jgi:nicotinate-nucleotide pyrophosphorylase (carboxylating)
MSPATRTLVDLALAEDLGEKGDLTSRFFVAPEHRSLGRIVAREACVVSGHEVARETCTKLGGGLAYEAALPDGAAAETGDLVATLAGPTRLVLSAERTVLNFLQRLSGVATTTRRYATAIAHTRARLLDTRKTTPGWRELEKAAVLHGGGTNHRIGLFDAVMVKDNHLVANSDPVDLAERIAALRREHPGIKVEFEADRLDQVEAFLRLAGIDAILLDNMQPDRLRAAVALRDELAPAMLLEASGGVTLDTIAAIAETGVDFVSVGALTHSVRAVDLGLDLEEAR